MTTRVWMLFVTLLAPALAMALTGCHDAYSDGCKSDEECRYERVCDMQLRRCIAGADAGTSLVDAGDDAGPGTDPVNREPDAARDERDQRRIDEFSGQWRMTVNGTLNRPGGRTYLHDQPWLVTIEEGEAHDLAVTFGNPEEPTSPEANPVPEVFLACEVPADLSAGGFTLVAASCRGGSMRLDTFRGTGSFDQFDDLSLELEADGEELSTQNDITWALRMYGAQ